MDIVDPGMLSEVRSGRHVIVHCAAGIGRAGTAACSVLLAAGLSLSRPSDEWRLVLELVRSGEQAAFIRRWAVNS